MNPTTQAIQADISAFISDTLVQDQASTITAHTPLLEWGILSSMNITRLIAFVRDRFGVSIPPHHITGENFQSVSRIAEMVENLSIKDQSKDPALA